MRTIIATLALNLLCACTSGPDPVAAPQSAPRPTEITASCGGGFTGGSEGVTITADHHVIRWRQATAGAQRSETDLGAKPAFAADIRRQLDAIRFADVHYDQPGNMACSLRAGDHSVSWPQGDPNAPAGVLAIHQAVFMENSRE